MGFNPNRIKDVETHQKYERISKIYASKKYLESIFDDALHYLLHILGGVALERKALPKELICFSFSTGFLFSKKKSVVLISLNLVVI
ncbi:hypothetical protein C5S35_06450 [Candidatus Methanophagaceae archaeon]|nr:hypothetical protein C5S35_06450 [Methanophagales archaeon]